MREGDPCLGDPPSSPDTFLEPRAPCATLRLEDSPTRLPVRLTSAPSPPKCRNVCLGKSACRRRRRSQGCGLRRPPPGSDPGTDPTRTQPPHKALHHRRRVALSGHQARTQESRKERLSPRVSHSLPSTQRHFRPHLRQRPPHSRRRPGFRDLAQGVWVKMGKKWFWLQPLAMFRLWFRVKKSIRLDLGKQPNVKTSVGHRFLLFSPKSASSPVFSPPHSDPDRGLLVPAVGEVTECASGGLQQ